jgi:hypothetical protein
MGWKVIGQLAIRLTDLDLPQLIIRFFLMLALNMAPDHLQSIIIKTDYCNMEKTAYKMGYEVIGQLAIRQIDFNLA